LISEFKLIYSSALFGFGEGPLEVVMELIAMRWFESVEENPGNTPSPSLEFAFGFNSAFGLAGAVVGRDPSFLFVPPSSRSLLSVSSLLSVFHPPMSALLCPPYLFLPSRPPFLSKRKKTQNSLALNLVPLLIELLGSATAFMIFALFPAFALSVRIFYFSQPIF
jgi:hypothetical protein